MRFTLLTSLISLLLAGVSLSPPASGAAAVSRGWMVVLNDPPVVQRYPGRIETTRAVSRSYRQRLVQQQQNLRSQIESMNVRVTGAVQHLANALFVVATPQQAEGLRGLAAVKAVLPLRRYHKEDQLSLSKVQAAWATSGIGGQGNAGAGLKIAILDTGIDQTHPSFQDNSLTPPSGYPVCDVPSNCAFTNKKVIVARSYVSDLAAGSNPSDPAADSRPDDYSARDLDGHGTAVASVAAGVPASHGSSSLIGVAPKAFLGNYKIFGSPEVNNTASDQGIITALEDAVQDGMDIVNLSVGGPAFSGPLDTGTACGNPPGSPCDPSAMAVEQAVQNGQVLVVAAAGNEGDTGYQNGQSSAPTFGTISSPADAPSALAAGGLQNDITYAESVTVSGPNVPSNLQRIAAFESADGPAPSTPLTAPAVDVTQAGNTDGLLCTALSGSPLQGKIALVLRGNCTFNLKVTNAQSAGAVGVIFVNNSADVSSWGGLANTQIPAFLVFQSDGQNLKTYVNANPNAQVTMDPSPNQVSASALGLVPGSVASFTSRGPATGTNALKPDVSAAATDFLLAAENYDVFGDLYSADRFAHADGTSFSTPMLAGAAALVKQANPKLTPLQVKSALVNTATLSGVQNQDGTAAASISEVGAGLAQVQNAVLSTVQVVPSTVSFGLLSGALPASQTLTLSNSGAAAASLALSVTQPTGLTGTQVLVNKSTSTNVSVPAGQSVTVTVSLSGNVPLPSRYEGAIAVTGGPVPLTVPYMFLVSDNTAYDVIPLYGGSFDGPINQELPPGEGPLAIRVIDKYGAPVPNVPVQWGVTRGAGTILSGPSNTSLATDQYGIAFASVTLGPRIGHQQFSATVNGMTVPFDGNARVVPTISQGGIVDAASFAAGRAVAPGSIISIFGSGLSDFSDSAFALPLPLGIGGVAFSFDVPSANISVPGRFYYVSPNQLNVQVPWELAGQASAIVKVIINYTYSAEYTLPLATYSPGFFATQSGTQSMAVALDANNKVIGPANAAVRGNVIQLFLNGLGPVNNQPASGSAVSDAAATTTTQPTITIGGQPASVQFSGLAPGFVGLYQVNVVVPSGVSPGTLPMTCTIGGVTSTQVYLPVQ